MLTHCRHDDKGERPIQKLQVLTTKSSTIHSIPDEGGAPQGTRSAVPGSQASSTPSKRWIC